MSAEPDGLNPTQLWVAGTALLAGVVLVVAFRMPVLLGTGSDVPRLVVDLFEGGTDGLRLVQGCRLEPATPLTIRARTPEGGHVAVYWHDAAGGPVQPMLARGLRSEPALTGVNDLPGAAMPDRAGSIVVVRCPSAFVVDPERPEALWSCESRAVACTPR